MIQVNFQRSWSSDGWEVFARRFTKTGRIPYKIEISEMQEACVGERVEPSIHLDLLTGREILAALIEGLRQADLLPKETATESELRATLRHMADLRSLVFEKIPPEGAKP